MIISRFFIHMKSLVGRLNVGQDMERFLSLVKCPAHFETPSIPGPTSQMPVFRGDVRNTQQLGWHGLTNQSE